MVKFSIKVSAPQRELLADKLADAGNLAAGGLIFGQAVADHAFSPAVAICGFLAWAGFIVVAALVRGTRR